MRSFLVLACLCSPAVGQFSQIDADNRNIMIHAHYKEPGQLPREESVFSSADAMMPWDVTETLAACPDSDEPCGYGIRLGGYARAFQDSHVSDREVFVAGGIGEVYGSTRGGALANNSAAIDFRILSRTHVRLTFDTSIDTTSSGEWSGLSKMLITGNLDSISIGADIVGETVRLYPEGMFTVDPDGMAHASYDNSFFLEPGGYTMRLSAISACGSQFECIGQPVDFQARLVMAPEPSTWALALSVCGLHVIRLLRRRRSG